jgi:hypothetical protein
MRPRDSIIASDSMGLSSPRDETNRIVFCADMFHLFSHMEAKGIGSTLN